MIYLLSVSNNNSIVKFTICIDLVRIDSTYE